MDVSIQPNTHLIREVSVTPNPQAPNLLRLKISQGRVGAYSDADLNLILTTDVWQRVTDALAAAGVTPVAVSS